MKKLYLLDAYALIYRGYYALISRSRPNSKGHDTSAVLGFLNSFEDILNQATADAYVAVVFDPPGPTFRHEAYSDYKAQRESSPEAIKFAIPYVYSIIEAFGVQHYEVEGYEADDLIGTIAHQAVAADPEVEVFMITPDKDYGQLVGERISILKPRTGGGFDRLGAEEVVATHGIRSVRQVIDYLALMGDSSDNVPGCPGVGKVTAAKLLQQFEDIDDIYRNITEVKGAKLQENLTKHEEQVRLSQELVTIDTNVPFDFDLEAMRVGQKDLPALVALYEELEFRSKLKKLQEQAPAPQGIAVGLFDTIPQTTQEEVATSFQSMASVQKRYKMVESAEEVQQLVKQLESVELFAFDTETDSLDALTSGIVGISFATQADEGFYLPLSELHAEATAQLAPFRSLFANPNITKVGQNLKFDLEVISRYGIAPVGPYWDTMLAHYLINPELRHGMDAMAEALLNYKPQPITELIGPKGRKQKTMREIPQEQIAPYAAEDADITLQLYHKLKPEVEQAPLNYLFYEMEMPLMEVLLKMEQTGVRLNTKAIREATEDLRSKLSDLEQELYRLVDGYQFNINSPREVGILLFEELALVEKPKKTKTGQYATGEAELLKIAHLHPVVDKILKYRGLNKLINTYVEPLPNLINKQTGRIHTTYNQAVTATGRLSSSDPNLQNIPVRDEEGRPIRKAFTALYPERGDLFLSADYSQIELRLMAHFSQDEQMIAAFQQGLDIHTMTAARVYGTDIEGVTKEMRYRAKATNFSIIYGITAFGLSNQLQIPRGEAQSLINGYFEIYPGVAKYMEEVKALAKEQGYVETLFGRRRYLPDILSQNSVVRGYAERTAINAPLQGSAADIIKLAMVRIEKRLQREQLKAAMIMQVHDELNFSVPQEEQEVLARLIKEEMEGIYPELRVPLIVDVGIGANWLEAH